MERGQITIDLLLAFLAVVVFTAVFGAISAQTIASQNVISIQAQQKAIGENLAEIISTSKVLGSANASSSGRIVYSVPKIFDNEGKAVSCDITVGPPLRISSSFDLKTVNTGVVYVLPSGVSVGGTLQCGKEIIITVS